MSVERECEVCRATFTAQRASAKYCSQRCRNQASWTAHEQRQARRQREAPSPKEARLVRRGQIEESLEERLRGVMADHRARERGQRARGTTHDRSQPSTPVTTPSGHAGGVEPTDG